MKLSILIPSRNEMFLRETVEDILKNIYTNTEIIVIADGQWPEPPLPQHKRVNIIYVPEAIGQRAAANLACKVAQGKYVMKVDAHCSFDKGFDIKMIKGFRKMGEDNVMVPIMRNLHAFDWVCPNGHKRYQGPSGPCKECGEETQREMKWIGKERPQSVSYRFDQEPHFQYFNAYKKTDKYKKDVKTGFTETMSLQGSCFMCTKKLYQKLNLCDEKAGSWGNQGIEVALAAWLTGHKVLVNHNTWYAHMFRTQGGDFSFPYENKGRDVSRTKKYIKDKFWNKKHPKQIHSVDWLIKKFNPPGWEDNANTTKSDNIQGSRKR